MIENHVTSLDLSRKLHELGIRKPSIFYWGYEDGNYHVKHYHTCIPHYPAYLSSELFEILPYRIEADGQKFLLHIEKYCDRPFVCYAHEELWKNYQIYMTIDKYNLSCILAKILINLIEKGHVNVEDLN